MSSATVAENINWGKIRDRLSRHILTDGARLKRDLTNDLRILIRYEGWSHLTDPSTMQPFTNFAAFLLASYPVGAGVGQLRDGLTYGDIVQLCRDDAEVLQTLTQRMGGPNRKGAAVPGMPQNLVEGQLGDTLTPAGGNAV